MKARSCYRIAALAGLLVGGGLAHAEGRGWVTDDKGCKHAQVDEAAVAVTWTGACVDGLAEGEGTQQWSIASGGLAMKYTGAMVRGLHQGRGQQLWQDGLRYEGNYVDGWAQGPGVVTMPQGERHEVTASRGRFAVPGLGLPVVPGVVCKAMGRPQLPVVRWKGRAAYRASAIVTGGRVTRVSFLSLEEGVPPEVDRQLRQSMLLALTRDYDCPGNHVFDQEFAFNISP